MNARQKNIYFIKPVGMDGPIKIGCANVPTKRLLELSVWSPFQLEIIACVPGTYADEQFLHSCFAEDHSHREWFKASDRLRDAIDKIAMDGSVEAVRPILAPVGTIRNVGRGSRPVPAYREGYRSYNSRVLWAEKRLREALGENGAWRTPGDIQGILSRWHGNPYRAVLGTRPTPDEFVRLDEFLSDPAAYSVVPPWRREAA